MQTRDDYWQRRGALVSWNGLSLFLVTLTNVIWGGTRVLGSDLSSLADKCSSGFLVFTSIHVYIQLACAILVGCLILLLILVKGWAGILLGCCPRKLVACKRICAKKRLRSSHYSTNGSFLDETSDFCQKSLPKDVKNKTDRPLDCREALLVTGSAAQKKLE